jgi:hypothetical protein
VTGRHVAIAYLFQSIAQAHHRAFAATKGKDPDWPGWYARELAEPLSSLLGSTVEPGYLTTALRKLDQNWCQRTPSAGWSLYYADWFVARQSVA